MDYPFLRLDPEVSAFICLVKIPGPHLPIFFSSSSSACIETALLFFHLKCLPFHYPFIFTSSILGFSSCSRTTRQLPTLGLESGTFRLQNLCSAQDLQQLSSSPSTASFQSKILIKPRIQQQV